MESTIKRIGHGIAWFFDAIYVISSIVARVLLVAMVLIISVNVFMRYVLNSGLQWGEEIALILVGWFVFLSIPMGIRKKLHISLHLWRKPKPLLDTVLLKLAAVGIVVVGGVLFVYGNRLIGVASRSIMPATGLPSSLLYMVLPLAAVLMIYEGFADLIGYETDTSPGEDDQPDDERPATTIAGEGAASEAAAGDTGSQAASKDAPEEENPNA